MRHLSLHQGHVAIASITWHELRFGIARLPSGRRKEGLLDALDSWRDIVPILEYDVQAAEWHARERARLLAAGRIVEIFDGQIAAIAAIRQLTLVTANMRDFHDYQGLTVVDWSQ